MEKLVMRGGVWLFVALLLLLAAAASSDWAFSVHMSIACLAALIAAFASGKGFDFLSQRYPVLSADNASKYDDDLIRFGLIATIFWGLAGFLAGLYIALQLAFPALNLNFEYTTFGRLRPLHTSAVIFAFGGNALIATSFYVVQRTCRARLAFPSLARFVFWGYQLFIVLAATGYLMGVTQSKEYAEPEWYVDLWLTVVWVSYLAVFVGTLMKRKEPHIYVANWF
ncbi:cbb3-type cytochrome c oxidase subunit I, partial [Sphingorhabdus sp.]